MLVETLDWLMLIIRTALAGQSHRIFRSQVQWRRFSDGNRKKRQKRERQLKRELEASSRSEKRGTADNQMQQPSGIESLCSYLARSDRAPCTNWARIIITTEVKFDALWLKLFFGPWDISKVIDRRSSLRTSFDGTWKFVKLIYCFALFLTSIEDSDPEPIQLRHKKMKNGNLWFWNLRCSAIAIWYFEFLWQWFSEHLIMSRSSFSRINTIVQNMAELFKCIWRNEISNNVKHAFLSD